MARERLDLPAAPRRGLRGPSVDAEAFGNFSERIARFIGTGRFLVYMTVFVIVWLAWNTLMPTTLRFDPFPFIFLTLMLSLQASYAAPLILLAQNRQDDRDRVSFQQDRAVAAQYRADMEFLAREIAALRLGLGELATREFIRTELRELTEDIVEEFEELTEDEPARPGRA
jgi:uncharacterized membrane protein